MELLISKTIASVHPVISYSYRINRPKAENKDLCFEILGFDIIFDENLKPFLLEVNHSPSFSTDSLLDYNVKKNLIEDTFIMVNPSVKEKKL